MRRFALIRKTLIVCALVAVFALALGSGPAQIASAQTPTPNQINEVARELWCPLCNGVRLDNCDLQACIQMREVISQKLEAGESTDNIKAYFVQQYGDVVLGQPSTEGFNLIAWIFPILAAVVGLGWVAYLVVTWRKKQAAPAVAASGAPSGGQLRRPGEEPDDYMKRVERELRETE
ncbi:MAG: cytochrome c-type biogenesis protein CcmH [Anaerolineae bacterium]|jgi:cytochrome c-type biogenesis protein CcmH|nr:cytochrome c-type biogenesis protein CcmH [Anaerolineae bacterium]